MKIATDAIQEQLAADASTDPELLAALAQTLTPRTPNPRLRARLLESVASPGLRWAPLFGKLGALFELADDALSQIAERASLPSEWQAGPIPGVDVFHLDGGPSLGVADVGLVRVQEGLSFPEHRHLGEERTLILQGRARESNGVLRQPGDAVVMAGGSSHAFEVLEGGPLIYALVLFGGVEIGGLKVP